MRVEDTRSKEFYQSYKQHLGASCIVELVD
jgi:hypothetical protein